MRQVWEDLQRQEIEVFEFSRDADDDESVIADPDALALPIFAVCASETVIAADGRNVRGRAYPWGFVDGEERERGRERASERERERVCVCVCVSVCVCVCVCELVV